MTIRMASIDGVDTPSGNLPLYFYIFIFIHHIVVAANKHNKQT